VIAVVGVAFDDDGAGGVIIVDDSRLVFLSLLLCGGV
jgi:hypothetical protein